VNSSSSSPPSNAASGQPCFHDLFREHFEPLTRAVGRYGVPVRYREDVAQEVLLAVLRALPRYDSIRAFRPWLYTAAYRIARRFLRKNRHHLEALKLEEFESDSATSEPRTPGPDAEERHAQHEAEVIFEQIVGAFDDDLRVVFLMHEVDQIATSEIAIALCLPEGTVTSRLRRARLKYAAAVHRLRAAERFNAGGALLVPLALLDPARLFDVTRPRPAAQDELRTHVWKRLVTAISGSARRSASSLAACAPRQIASVLLGGSLIGALGGGVAERFTRPNAPLAPVERIKVRPDSPPHVPIALQGATAPRGGAVSSATPIQTSAAPSANMLVPLAPRDKQSERLLLAHARRALAKGELAVAFRDLARLSAEFPASANSTEREELRRAVLERAAAAGPSTP
jgi:RNA polymerase sigma-70 factor, ECF subfamily